MLIAAFSRTPFTGTPPERSRESPGAQNQECLGRSRPAPQGGLRVQNLSLVRSCRCAWLCRANAPGPLSAIGEARPKAFPLEGGRCPRRGRMRVLSWEAPPSWRELVQWCGSASAPEFSQPTLPVRSYWAGRCPAPTRGRDRFCVRRRGGTLGRPPFNRPELEPRHAKRRALKVFRK